MQTERLIENSPQIDDAALLNSFLLREKIPRHHHEKVQGRTWRLFSSRKSRENEAYLMTTAFFFSEKRISSFGYYISPSITRPSSRQTHYQSFKLPRSSGSHYTLESFVDFVPLTSTSNSLPTFIWLFCLVSMLFVAWLCLNIFQRFPALNQIDDCFISPVCMR